MKWCWWMVPKHLFSGPKKQRCFYPGKKKRPTLKTQLVVDKTSQKVICTSFINGKRHDFHLFKQSSVGFQASTQRLTDSGYQGLQKIHTNSQLPNKKPRDNWQSKRSGQRRPSPVSGYSTRRSWVGLNVSKSFWINIETGRSALDWGLIWLRVFTTLSRWAELLKELYLLRTIRGPSRNSSLLAWVT